MTNIDSLDYEAGEALTTHKDIVQWMLDGGLVIEADGKLAYGLDEKGFCSLNSSGTRYSATGNFPGNVTWCKAILKRKAISWEDAVRAMLDGKHVWDKDGEEWRKIVGGIAFYSNTLGKLLQCEFDASHAPFYLTQPPSESKPVEAPKPRRKVSREDAICAMVRDPGQRAYSDQFEYRWSTRDLCVKVRHTDGPWVGNCSMDTSFPFYLDPPEER